MSVSATRGLGEGVYGPTEVARLAHIDAKRLRRWLYGYAYNAPDGARKHSPPLVQRPADPSLNFLDLVEVCFVKAFLDQGVSMPTVRAVQRDAARAFRTEHPFSSRRFETDGETIVSRHADDAKIERLLDMKRGQYLMKAVFDPLLKQIDYDRVTEEARRWWPMGKGRPIVIDPARAFGKATVAKSRVPTSVLFGAFRAGEKPDAIADWFDVDVDEVIAAIEFETSLQTSSQLRRAS